jgi:FkbM family methyltransferase
VLCPWAACARGGILLPGPPYSFGQSVLKVREFAKSSLDVCGLGRHARALKAILPEGALARRSRLDDEHLRLLCAFQLRADSNCIDVGANVGDVTEMFLRYAPDGAHIAYEPIPQLAASLAVRYPRIEVRNRALSNSTGTRTFVYVESNPAYSGFLERTYPGREELLEIAVQTEPLDQSLPSGYVPDLIKIDVEGAEQLVLEGAIKTLSVHKPTVAFEHGPGGAGGYGTKATDIFGLLVIEAGLRVLIWMGMALCRPCSSMRPLLGTLATGTS